MNIFLERTDRGGLRVSSDAGPVDGAAVEAFAESAGRRTQTMRFSADAAHECHRAEPLDDGGALLTPEATAMFFTRASVWRYQPRRANPATRLSFYFAFRVNGRALRAAYDPNKGQARFPRKSNKRREGTSMNKRTAALMALAAAGLALAACSADASPKSCADACRRWHPQLFTGRWTPLPHH